MRSVRRGKNTSLVEVTNVSKTGFWLLLKGEELFVPFKQFPWFREASIGELVNVDLPAAHHLYWPDLDIDLAVDSILHPDKFPLVSRERPLKARVHPKAASKAKGPDSRPKRKTR